MPSYIRKFLSNSCSYSFPIYYLKDDIKYFPFLIFLKWLLSLKFFPNLLLMFMFAFFCISGWNPGVEPLGWGLFYRTPVTVICIWTNELTSLRPTPGGSQLFCVIWGLSAIPKKSQKLFFRMKFLSCLSFFFLSSLFFCVSFLLLLF